MISTLRFKICLTIIFNVLNENAYSIIRILGIERVLVTLGYILFSTKSIMEHIQLTLIIQNMHSFGTILAGKSGGVSGSLY